MAYGDFKDLTRRTASDKILHDKAFNVAKNPKYDGCQRGLASVVYEFFEKNPFHLQINLLPLVLFKMEICQTSVLWNFSSQLRSLTVREN